MFDLIDSDQLISSDGSSKQAPQNENSTMSAQIQK